MNKVIAGAVITATIVGSASVLAPAPASAWTGRSAVYVNGANFRTGPYLNRTVTGQGQKGDPVIATCGLIGDWVADPRNGGNDLWYHARNERNGAQGFISMSMLEYSNDLPAGVYC